MKGKCVECAQDHRKGQTARTKERKARGVCPAHPDRPSAPGKTMCQQCLWAKRERHLVKTFGLTLEDYAWMEYNQDRRCAICRQPCRVTGVLAVDHCHESGLNRALLCHPCNRTLGTMNDSPERLRAAAAYLEQWKVAAQ